MEIEYRQPAVPPVEASRMARLLCLYGWLYALFHILPAFLNWEIRDRLMVADLFDLFTPYVLLFGAGLVAYRMIKASGRFLPMIILLLLGAVTFVEGHGIHLSANAIHRHLNDTDATAIVRLTYFFDERLGHILWDSGNLLIAISFILFSLKLSWPENQRKEVLFVWLAGAVYGFTFFVNSVEGQTVVFKLPAAVVLFLLLLAALRMKTGRNPVLDFFRAAYFVALILFCIWFCWQGGFPEFSALGWI